MPKQTLKLMARLVQIHADTHPERLARRFGVTAGYIRQQWRQYLQHEMASIQEALIELDKS